MNAFSFGVASQIERRMSIVCGTSCSGARTIYLEPNTLWGRLCSWAKMATLHSFTKQSKGKN
jgi:hypothetical protein